MHVPNIPNGSNIVHQIKDVLPGTFDTVDIVLLLQL